MFPEYDLFVQRGARQSLMICLLIAVSFILFPLPAAMAADGKPAEKADAATAAPKTSSQDPISDVEDKWGIKVVSLKLTAHNYMLDFRYRLNDPEKAKPFFDRKIKPYVIDQASGIKLLVPTPPKIGALRQTRRGQAGKNYFILFGNPGGTVKSGSKVTIVVGDAKIENLVVQ